MEHFDHIQVEEKMGLSGIDSATRTLYQQFGYRSSNDISLEKMQRRERYFSDDEASWRSDQQGVAGWDKVEKLAENLLEVGKTRLKYNESDVDNIVKLYEELQELDKKAVSHGRQFRP